MSASYDKSQRHTFVFSNLYQVYRKGKKAAQDAKISVGEENVQTHVLKVGNRSIEVKSEVPLERKVEAFRPVEFLRKRTEETKLPGAQAPSNQAVNQLKSNLKNLDDLHSRLQFMLKELEDLVKE